MIYKLSLIIFHFDKAYQSYRKFLKIFKKVYISKRIIDFYVKLQQNEFENYVFKDLTKKYDLKGAF